LGLPPAPGVIPPVIIPPFPLPLTGGPASGLGWDPFTGTLWFCDPGGMINNCMIGGQPLFAFPVMAIPPLLMGLTVNLTNGNIQVTDGIMCAEHMPNGGISPPIPFYMSANPYPVTPWAGPVSGMGFSLRPQRYGKGFTPSGGPAPIIGWGGGNSYDGNPAFLVNETGATIGSFAYLLYGFAPAIPGIPVGGSGAAIWISPVPLLGILPIGPVTTGNVTVPIPLPPGSAGAPIFLQFLNILNTSPRLELSDALSLTIGLP